MNYRSELSSSSAASVGDDTFSSAEHVDSSAAAGHLLHHYSDAVSLYVSVCLLTKVSEIVLA